MSNEIKEILDDLKDKCKYIEDYGYQYKRLSLEDIEILLDYITYLQELCDKYEEEHNTTFKEWQKDIQANKRAIEYIKVGKTFGNEDVRKVVDKIQNDLLDILEENNEYNK